MKTWVCRLLLFMVVITGFTRRDPALPELRLNNVSYGKDSLQKMDIVLVAGRSEKSPLVILIHGGGWMSGDKNDARVFMDDFAGQGCNVVSINYRLANAGHIHYKEIMQDVDAAVHFILKQADTWKTRNKNIILWGGSAGGHLAMLYAYSCDSTKIISSVITLGGPTKLDDRYSVSLSAKGATIDLLPLITGFPWTTDSLNIAYQYASPYYGKYYKPSLLAHGGADPLVSWLQAKLMTEKLTTSGIPNQMFIIQNGGHGGEGASQQVADSLKTTVHEWIKKYSY